MQFGDSSRALEGTKFLVLAGSGEALRTPKLLVAVVSRGAGDSADFVHGVKLSLLLVACSKQIGLWCQNWAGPKTCNISGSLALLLVAFALVYRFLVSRLQHCFWFHCSSKNQIFDALEGRFETFGQDRSESGSQKDQTFGVRTRFLRETLQICGAPTLQHS